jgi:molybdenum cofactor synthesis domain-containing protein
MSQSIEIICIGNELLIGKTLNTNAQWLAKRITALGLSVRRITMVGDDVDEISSAVLEVIQHNPRFLITTGGLGPTFDDKTLEGLAKALELRIGINEEAFKMVKEKYHKYVEEDKMKKAELTPPRVKMAKLPEGARPLSNPVGTAPGIIIEHGDITIVSFDGLVASFLKQVAGDVIYFEMSIEATGVIESEIAPLIERAMCDNPYVYIKSHPKGIERISRIEFHFSTTAKNSGIARKRVSQAFVQLSELIQEKGGKVKPIKTEN